MKLIILITLAEHRRGRLATGSIPDNDLVFGERIFII